MSVLDSIDDPRTLLEGLFEHSPVAFQIYRADGQSLLVNRAFRELFQSEPPPEYNLFKDEIAAEQGMQGLIRRAFAGERITLPPVWYDPRELKHITQVEGRRAAIEMTMFPLFDAARTIPYVAICMKDVTAEMERARDLTELRQTSEALRKSEEQLRQSQKLDAVGRLAGGVAHDFNNLLSVILSYCELLKDDLNADDAHRADLDEIKKAAEQAAALTRQLLAFSRQQVFEARVLDPNEIVKNVSKILARVVGEDVELKLLLAPRLGKVNADPHQIEQVLMNLVVNARDAMPTGGKLTIETSDTELDAAYAAEHLGVAAGAYVVIAVSDTGVGMNAATQARIFEPFFTTKGLGKGTGLGLSTVFGIVKQSGGSIWFYSEPGAGTTFKVYLPRTRSEADALPPPRPPSTDVRGTETILLVEDEDQVRAVACGILKRSGYHVLEARTPGEALLICEQHPVNIHLLVTDVVMPKMNGRQLAERVAAMRPSIRILFMSGYTDDVITHHGILDSGVAFLQKPFTPDSLARKVRLTLDEVARQRA